MTNRHWYDDSNGDGREGGGSRESSFPSCHNFFFTVTITAIKFNINVFFCFVSFFLILNSSLRIFYIF